MQRKAVIKLNNKPSLRPSFLSFLVKPSALNELLFLQLQTISVKLGHLPISRILNPKLCVVQPPMQS